MPTNHDLLELTEFRHELPLTPELSGEKMETARTIATVPEPLSPTRILTGFVPILTNVAA